MTEAQKPEKPEKPKKVIEDPARPWEAGRDAEALTSSCARAREAGSITVDKARFLIALVRTGMVSQGAAAAAVTRQTVYNWRKADQVFAELWTEIDAADGEAIERTARWIAANGVVREVGWHHGEPGGRQIEFFPALMMFFLERLMPEKYDVRKTLDSGATDLGERTRAEIRAMRASIPPPTDPEAPA